MTDPTCHWDPELGWLGTEHKRGCKDSTCRGCRPCGKPHCAFRGRCANHVDTEAGIITCPSCIGRVRRDIAAVVELYAVSMPDEAEAAGVDSEAFNLAGPAASADQLDARRRYTEAARGWCDWPRKLDDPHHPYVVLGEWDLALREIYGPQTDLFITVSRAADYLTGLLAGTFPHSLEFEAFAADVARCRSHMETVAHDSRQPERGRHCPRCVEEHGHGPKLQKRYARHPGLRSGETCGADGCRTCDGTHDTWHCPADPDHWWTEAEYRSRVATDYVEHADWLSDLDTETRTGVRAGTVRKWAERGDVKRKRINGRVVYRVADVLTRMEDRA